MKGVTLLEAIVVLSLTTIVFLFTMSSFLQRSTGAKNLIAQSQLFDLLHQAQNIANATDAKVKVCLSANGNDCAAEAATMVLVLIDNTLFTSAHIKGDGALRLRSYPYYRNYISVEPAVIAKSDNGTFWYCSKRKMIQWAMTVSQSGEPHVVKPDKELSC